MTPAMTSMTAETINPTSSGVYLKPGREFSSTGVNSKFGIIRDGDITFAVEFAHVDAGDTAGVGWQVLAVTGLVKDGYLSAVIAQYGFFRAVTVQVDARDLGHFVGHGARPEFFPIVVESPHAAVLAANDNLARGGITVQFHFADFGDGLSKRGGEESAAIDSVVDGECAVLATEQDFAIAVAIQVVSAHAAQGFGILLPDLVALSIVDADDSNTVGDGNIGLAVDLGIVQATDLIATITGLPEELA